MSDLSATYLVVLMMGFIALNLCIIALVYAGKTVTKSRKVLSLRPIAHAFFVGNVILVGVALMELLYMTAFFLLRAPFALNVTDTDAPGWLQMMSVGQYYVFYFESMAASIMLIIICEGIRCLPEHRGLFKFVPIDPRDLTDEQLRQIHHEVLIVKDERGINVKDRQD